MARCSICARPDLKQINEALVSGISERETAQRYGLKKSTVHVHRARCIGSAIVKAFERHHVEMGEDLLSKLDFLFHKSLAVIDRAERRRRDPLLLKAIAQSLDVLKLRADLTGVKPPEPARMNYHIVFNGGRPSAVLGDGVESTGKTHDETDHPAARMQGMDALVEVRDDK